MRAFEVMAEVDEQHQIRASLPESARPGPARLLVLLPDEEDETAPVWMQAVAREWMDELADERQDIYTLDDGELVDATRWHLPCQLPLW